MKPIIAFLLLVAFTNKASSQNDPKWMRYSAISPDGKTIVFTFKGDI